MHQREVGNLQNRKSKILIKRQSPLLRLLKITSEILFPRCQMDKIEKSDNIMGQQIPQIWESISGSS